MDSIEVFSGGMLLLLFGQLEMLKGVGFIR